MTGLPSATPRWGHVGSRAHNLERQRRRCQKGARRGGEAKTRMARPCREEAPLDGGVMPGLLNGEAA